MITQWPAFCLLMLLSLLVNAQPKNDYIWLLGHFPNIPNEHFGGTKLDFHQTPREVSFFEEVQISK